jgi:Putative peptidoglycan-binding domain-containing protein
MIKIGHASIDENGKTAGGKTGDQTGKEICIRKWYNKPWNVYLECTDAVLAEKAAKIMEQICTNKNFGYDQSKRFTGYNSILINGISKAYGSFDCSTLTLVCYILAGLKVSEHNTTSTMRKALLDTGKFKEYTDKAHITSDSYAQRGGIFLREGHHVAMALENGTKINPYSVPTRTIKLGCMGEDVKWVQFELLAAGIRYVTVDGVKKELTVDGKCEKITDAAIRAYQKKKKLKVDGECGPITKSSLDA